MNEAAKQDHLCEAVVAGRLTGNVILLSHFDATLAKLSFLLSARAVDHERFASLNASSICNSTQRVWLSSARSFHVTANANKSGARLTILVAEHHPIRSKDQAIIDAAAQVAARVTSLSIFRSMIP